MRLFLDANVLFSAAWSDDNRLRVFFDLADSGVCLLVSSAFAMDEAQRNIALKRPESASRLSALFARIERVAEARPAVAQWAVEQGVPAKDAPILAAARQAGAEVLVTGDVAHFGHLFDREVEGLRVLSPAAALVFLLDRNDPAAAR